MSSDQLSLTFAALADPTRRAILSRLASGEATVSELAKPFSISQPAVSRHLRVLEDAGLIARGRDGQRRPSRIAAEPLREVADWVERYRQFWDERLAGLEKYLDEVQKKEKRRVRTKK
jgi:DNA-binding transcriptional ArsR family regulator